MKRQHSDDDNENELEVYPYLSYIVPNRRKFINPLNFDIHLDVDEDNFYDDITEIGSPVNGDEIIRSGEIHSSDEEESTDDVEITIPKDYLFHTEPLPKGAGALKPLKRPKAWHALAKPWRVMQQLTQDTFDVQCFNCGARYLAFIPIRLKERTYGRTIPAGCYECFSWSYISYISKAHKDHFDLYVEHSSSVVPKKKRRKIINSVWIKHVVELIYSMHKYIMRYSLFTYSIMCPKIFLFAIGYDGVWVDIFSLVQIQ